MPWLIVLLRLQQRLLSSRESFNLLTNGARDRRVGRTSILVVAPSARIPDSLNLTPEYRKNKEA
jgi:hypothetical protein